MTTLTFKTARAAKLAMTKAEKAYYAALNALNVAKAGPLTDERVAAWTKAETAVRGAWTTARDVFAAADARGDVYVKGFGVGVAS